MKYKHLLLVSSISNTVDIGNLGTAAYKDAGNSAGNVPLIMPNGKLDNSILPALNVTDVFTADSEEEMLALNADAGDICIRTDENKTYILTAEPASTLSNWTEIALVASVESVNNKKGVVTLDADDVGAVSKNDAITADTKCKITYDSKGLVTAGADLEASDLPEHEHSAADITSGVLATTYGGTGANNVTDARTNLNVYSKPETDALIPTDLSQLSNTTTNYINNTQLEEAIRNLGTIFTLKGSVSDVTDLPDTGNQLGDVYYVVNEDTTYVWMTDGVTEQWEELGTTLDSSDFLKKSQLLGTTGNATDNTMHQSAITAALNNKANISDIPTQLTDLSGIVPVTQGGTGLGSLTSGNFIIGNGTDNVTTLAVVPISKGGTNATNVSQARTNLGVYTRTSLYSNSSGSSGTITLSKSITNYKWIEIYYCWSGINGSVLLIPSDDTVTVNLTLSYTSSGAGQFIARSALAHVNGTTITFERNRTALFNIGGSSYTNTDKIKIRYVYGYNS